MCYRFKCGNSTFYCITVKITVLFALLSLSIHPVSCSSKSFFNTLLFGKDILKDKLNVHIDPAVPPMNPVNSIPSNAVRKKSIPEGYKVTERQGLDDRSQGGHGYGWGVPGHAYGQINQVVSKKGELIKFINQFIGTMGPMLFQLPYALAMIPFAIPALPLAIWFDTRGEAERPHEGNGRPEGHEPEKEKPSLEHPSPSSHPMPASTTMETGKSTPFTMLPITIPTALPSSTQEPNPTAIPTSPSSTENPTPTAIPTSPSSTENPTPTVIPTRPSSTENPTSTAIPTRPSSTENPTSTAIPTRPSSTENPTPTAIPTRPSSTENPTPTAIPTRPSSTENPTPTANPTRPSSTENPTPTAIPTRPSSTDSPTPPTFSVDPTQAPIPTIPSKDNTTPTPTEDPLNGLGIPASDIQLPVLPEEETPLPTLPTLPTIDIPPSLFPERPYKGVFPFPLFLNSSWLFHDEAYETRFTKPNKKKHNFRIRNNSATKKTSYLHS